MRSDVPAGSAAGLRIGLVASSYHHDVVGPLAEGARAAFAEAGGDPADLLEATAPGAFELVSIATAFAERDDVDGVVTLGCVITGETTHDRYICDAVANGLARLSILTGTPAAFGVLTCQTLEQARERAGGAKGNKGVEAMRATINAARVIESIRDGAPAEGAR